MALALNNLHGQHQTVCQKRKGIGNANTDCENRGMEFDMEKCGMLIKSGKRHIADGLGLSNQEKIRTLGEKETCKYLGILAADTIKQVKTKEKIKKEYLKRTRKILETKL